MAHILEFTVNKQIITWTNPCRVPVENTRGVLKARFEVDEEWDGLSLIAVFQSGAQKAVEVPFSGGLVELPAEVIRRGRLHVGLVGLGGGGSVRLTTKEMTHPVILYKSVSVDGGPPDEIAPEAWEQALTAIGDVSKLDTFDKSNLVNAINEVRRTGGGGGGGSGNVSSPDIDTIRVLDRAEYEALAVPRPAGTVYLIKG